MTIPAHLMPRYKGKLLYPDYGYKAGTWVTLIEASGDQFWIYQGKWKNDNVGALLDTGRLSEIRKLS